MSIATLPAPPPRSSITSIGETCPFGPVYRLTVEQFSQMVEAGILTKYDKVELLEGWLVEKMMKNAPHDATLTYCADVLRPFLGKEWHLRNQCSIITADSRPEPDLAVVSGAIKDYLRRQPGPDDIGLVIEVSDTTLARDRLKRRIYARALLPVYWIINLPEQVLEVYTDPDAGLAEPAYRQSQILTRDQTVTLTLGDATISLAVAELIPEE